MKLFSALIIPLTFAVASLSAMQQDMNQMNMNGVQTTDKGMIMAGEDGRTTIVTSSESLEEGDHTQKSED